jgi:hypothetical protein
MVTTMTDEEKRAILDLARENAAKPRVRMSALERRELDRLERANELLVYKVHDNGVFSIGEPASQQPDGGDAEYYAWRQFVLDIVQEQFQKRDKRDLGVIKTVRKALEGMAKSLDAFDERVKQIRADAERRSAEHEALIARILETLSTEASAIARAKKLDQYFN